MLWAMDELPKKQKAVIGLEDGSLTVSNDVGIAQIGEHMVLIRTRAIGLNPIDTKMKGPLAAPGAIAGIDFAGEVVALGAHAKTPAKIEVGDRVFGAATGYQRPKPTLGAFAEFVAIDSAGLMKIPDNWTFEQAASAGCSISTIGLALFKSLNVPGTPKCPAEKPVNVFVYGGSTTTGTMAIQLLKMSGLNPITVCSPQNFELAKSYGATAVFDYKQPSCIEDIRKYTKNSLKYVIDCVSEPETMEFCYKCLGRTGGKYSALEPYAEVLHTRSRTVVPDWVLGPSVLGEEITWPEPFTRQQNEELRNFGTDWFVTAQKLLDQDQLRPHPVRVVKGGLDGVREGLELLRKKQVSGQKLVCSLA